MAETSSGMGQGLAQVIGDSRAYDEFIKGRDMAMKLGMAEKQQRDERKGKIFTKIGATLDAPVWNRDTPYFQQKGKDLKQFVEDNLYALAKNDAKLSLQLEEMMGNYLSDAKSSIDAREVFQSEYAKLEADKEDAYDRPASFQALQGVTQQQPGDWGFVGNPLLVPKPKEIDLVKDFNTVLRPTLKDMATKDAGFYIDDKTGKLVVTTTSELESAKIKNALRERALHVPIYAQLSREFEKLPEADKLKYDNDPVEYYVDRFSEFAPGKKSTMTVKGDGKGMELKFDGNGAKTDKYRFTMRKEPLRQLEGVKNKKMSFKTDETPVGDIKIIDINSISDKEIAPIQLPIGGKEVKGVITEARQEPGKSWKVKFKVTEDAENYAKGETIELDYNSVKSDIIGKYGVDVSELFNMQLQQNNSLKLDIDKLMNQR